MPPDAEWPAAVALRAWPKPGRLVVRGLVAGADTEAVHQAGREALRRLRAEVLAARHQQPPLVARLAAAIRRKLRAPPAPPGSGEPFQPSRAEVAALAAAAAAQCRPLWLTGTPPLSIQIGLANARGDVADLEWRLEAGAEHLRWTCRTARWVEDGSAAGAAAVLSALSE